MSSAPRSIVIASRSRPEHHGPAVRDPRGIGREPTAGDRGQQRPVADQVGVSADRRGEMAVARRLEPGVTEVARVVVGLLQSPQHEARQPSPTVSVPRHPVVDQLRSLADEVRRLPGASARPAEPVASARRARRAARSAARRPSTRAARGPDRASARGATRAAPRPARWRRSSDARSAGGIRSARTESMATTFPASSNSNSGSEESSTSAARRARLASSAAAAATGGGERLSPRLGRAGSSPRTRGRPGRSRAAHPSGSPSGRTRPACTCSPTIVISTVTVSRS